MKGSARSSDRLAPVCMAPLALIALAVIFDQSTPAHWPFYRFLEWARPLRPRPGAVSPPGVIGAFALVVANVLAGDKGNLGMSRPLLMLGMIASWRSDDARSGSLRPCPGRSSAAGSQRRECVRHAQAASLSSTISHRVVVIEGYYLCFAIGYSLASASL